MNRGQIQCHHSLYNLRHRAFHVRRIINQKLDHVIRLLSFIPYSIEPHANNRSQRFSRPPLYLTNRCKPEDKPRFRVSIVRVLSSRECFIRFQPIWEEFDQFGREDEDLCIGDCVVEICFVSAFEVSAQNKGSQENIDVQKSIPLIALLLTRATILTMTSKTLTSVHSSLSLASDDEYQKRTFLTLG